MTAVVEDRLVRRAEAARLLGISVRTFDANERPHLPVVALGREDAKRRTPAWRLSDIWARINAKQRGEAA